MAVLQMQSPPNNVLTPVMCAGLTEALARAEAAEGVRAVLISGAGNTFSAGLPVSGLSLDNTRAVATLCEKIETCRLPVVAAVSGLALGVGLELVLACHFRLAHNKTRVGCPEVGLGLIPGAGATQRLPRLIGGEMALLMMMAGRPVPVTAPGLRGAFDQIVGADLLPTAMVFAETLAAKALAPRPVSERRDGFADSVTFDAALAEWRAQDLEYPNAPASDILECVEASRLLPFEAGLAFESERFEARIASEVFHALRHMSVSERRARQFPELKHTKAAPVASIGVIGVGVVGARFAVASLIAGFEVIVVERHRSAMVEGMKRIRRLLDRSVAEGRLAAARRQSLEAKLRQADDLVAVAEADFVLEASGQVPEVERQIFAQLDGVTKEGAVVAAHGPASDLAALAAETGSPSEILGLHFPFTTPQSRAAEVVVGPKTSGQTVATAVAVLMQMNMVPLRVEPSLGLAGHAVMTAALRAAEQMVLCGADPYAIDRAAKAWGFAMGPFEAADMAGLSGAWIAAGGAKISAAFAQAGQAGRAAGQGWYAYDAEGGARDFETALVSVRRNANRAQRSFDDGQIVERLLAAMANAGVGLLRKNVVRAPSDIDVVMVNGFGFPRWRGGPMMAAQTAGLVRIRATLREMQAEGDALASPDPAFDHLIKNGGHLAR